jgi:hypothetical protein
MEVLQAFVERLEKVPIPEIKSHKRQVKFNETEGDEIDLDRLRQGQPFWRKSEREETVGPTTITIVIDTSTAAHYDSADILWRGAAGVALTKILESKGYSVELWVVNGCKLFMGLSTRVMSSCCLKRCMDPLDMSTLINVVAGWFYRTVTFTLYETMCKKYNQKVEDGFGPPLSPTQIDLDHITNDMLRIYSSGVYAFNGAVSCLTHELEKINEHCRRGHELPEE